MIPHRLCLPLLLSVLASACSTSQATSPRGAIQAYTDALRDGRHRDAYALLSRETQSELSFEEFSQKLQNHPGEVRALVDSLSLPSDPAYVTATVTTRDGQTLELVYENGDWRIDESALDLYAQSSPERALTSFVRAFENRRYDVLLRFVPEAQLEGLDARTLQEAWEGEQKSEMEQTVSQLKQVLPQARFELLGDRATLSYGAGATVELVRERGSWKIEDFK